MDTVTSLIQNTGSSISSLAPVSSDDSYVTESVSSLVSTWTTKPYSGVTSNVTKNAFPNIDYTVFYAYEEKVNKMFKSLAGLGVWFAATSLLSLVLAVFLIAKWDVLARPSIDKYSIFSSKPLVLGNSISAISLDDSRAERIDQVFEKYNCPLEGYGEVFVREADKYQIPFWLVAAVSFQESSCGKKTPEPGGVESYNAWGWGVWGDNVKMFDNWEHGISVVSEYMKTHFYDNGITDTCVIMKTYTPPSNGSWCRGVQFFGDAIEEHKTN